MLRIGFKTQPTGTLKRLNQAIDSKSITLDDAFFVEEGKWFLSLTVSTDGVYDFNEIFQNIQGTVLFHQHQASDKVTNTNRTQLMVFSLEPYPFILNLLLRNKAIPNKIILKDQLLHVVVSVDVWDNFQRLGEEVEDKLGNFELLEVTQETDFGTTLNTAQRMSSILSELTDKQVEALETAYEMGYFDSPRKATASEVGEKLEVAQSTFSQRLRDAEHALLKAVLE
ncbi:HTH DNA binding domain-containing protein [Halogranum gelatinilyticum]|uniref:HTH DNA binding domain-containing protein n=1 Tax=Halogranum gelatinilyticum TaxID=660521 RepID=A0A1G9YZ45_9EURY|nr:helix-turn-helix domain-containing protein [Halogranum gelatinilyticum]SDN14398.1 HTH DNA binding domain-containing protein [Halogranum gelatinilyticum]